MAIKNLFETYVQGMSNQAVVEHMFSHVLGLESVAAARVDYWVKQMSKNNLDAGGLLEAVQADLAGTHNPNGIISAADFQNSKDRMELAVAAGQTAANLDEVKQQVQGSAPVAPPIYGDAIMLTAGQDNLTGSADNDVFTANVVQNDFGNLVNSLATGDIINGGGGDNILKAQLINAWGGQGQGDALAVMPMTNNVQTVEIQALNMLGGGTNGRVLVDAVHMNGTNHYASVNSRGDLDIVNVRIQNTQITEDITLEMRNTIANNADINGTQIGSDLNVWFEQSSLRAAPEQQEADAQFFIQLADALQTDADNPLVNVRITDLQVTHDGNEIVLQNIESADNTYDGLVLAVQEALDAAGFGDRYKAELGEQFDSVAGVATQVPGFNVVVKDTQEPAVPFEEENVLIGVGNKLGAGSSASVQGDSGVFFEADTTQFKVTSNVILDNVGMGSHGGDVFVGSMSDSASSTGIQVFQVEVRNNSNIGEITTTTGTAAGNFTSRFDELHITNGTGYTGNLVFRNTDRTDDGTNINFGDLIRATNFAGDLTLGSGGTNQLRNVDTIDARITGNVSVDAEYDGANFGGTALPSSDQAFAINTGTGNDTITANVVGQSATGTTTSLTITSQGGNNTVNLSSTDVQVNAVEVIMNGNGADVITGGATHLTVNSGAGNDVIYAENTGATKNATAAHDAALAVGTFDSTNIGTANGTNATAITPVQLLLGRTVQVTMSFDTNTAAAGTTGFESVEVKVEAANGPLTTQRDLNEAIAKAINTDPVLKYLAEAEVHESTGELEVTYLVDGADVTGGLSYTLSNVWDTDLTTQQKTAVRDAVRDQLNDSNASLALIETEWNKIEAGATPVDATGGVNSTADGGNNVINAGTGNDIIVLSSDAAAGTADTVVISAVTSGTFGKNTIVHFDDTTGTGDQLRFDFLDNELQYNAGGSASTVSRDVIDAALETTLTNISANNVAVTTFNALNDTGGNNYLGATATFDSIGNILSALNNNATFGVAATTNLVGSVQKSILLIENNANLGEYKVVQVTSSNTAGTDEFASATVVGTLDFGSNQDFAGNILAQEVA